MGKSRLNLIVRPEDRADYQSVQAVNKDAFDQPDEANLVDALRTNGDLVISLIAECDDLIVGHIAISRLSSPDQALALAPVSVLPRHQGRGIGSALIEQSITLARETGFVIIFALGNPEYYTRFGFSVETATPFASPYAGPHFMARWLNDTRVAHGPVIYPPAFDDLD